MTNLDDRVELLRHAWLFSGCSDDELSRIAGLATPRTAATGDTMCVEGEPGDDFFVIVEGSATASVGGTTVGDLDAGSFFGEMALIDGGDRTATVTATTSMQLLVLSRNDFNTMLSTAMPAVAPKLLEVVGQRMRDLQAQAGTPLAY